MGRNPGYVTVYPGIATYIPVKELVRKTYKKFQYLYSPFFFFTLAMVTKQTGGVNNSLVERNYFAMVFIRFL